MTKTLGGKSRWLSVADFHFQVVGPSPQKKLALCSLSDTAHEHSKFSSS
jgi:hypothetical protein